MFKTETVMILLSAAKISSVNGFNFELNILGYNLLLDKNKSAFILDFARLYILNEIFYKQISLF